MPPKGFFITGTDTGVGKTVATACILAAFKNRGINTGVMKPIETGVDPACNSMANSDAEFLLQVGQTGDASGDICQYRFKTPASPWQAALMEERSPPDPDVILNSYKRLAGKHDAVLVEGVGGLLVPLQEKYMVADLIRELGLPVILVIPLRVGTINHALLTLEAARRRDIPIAGIILNASDGQVKSDVEKLHPEMIEKLSGAKVLGECPFIANLSPESFTPELITRIESQIDIQALTD